MAAAVELGALPVRAGTLERGQRGPAVECHEGVPAGLDRLDPLGVLAQRDAGDPEQVGLLLDAARIGEDRACVHRQLREVEVAERWHQPHVRRRFEPLPQPRLREPGSRARVERNERRERERLEQLDEQLESLARVHVAGPVCGHEEIATGLDAVVGEGSGAPLGDRLEGQRHVRHHVAHQVGLPHRALPREVVDRGLGRAEEEIAHLVDQDTVHLLGHPAVERAHPRLHVGHRHPGLRRRERGGQRRVRVSVDQRQIRLCLGEHPFEETEDPRGLLGVRAAPGAELAVRRGYPELLEEDLRELVVVVLAGVDEHLAMALA